MNLATIEMDRKAAAAAVRSYRAAVRVARPIPEDVELLRGYRQLARGRRLIRLSEAFEAAGFADFTYQGWNGGIIRADRHGHVPKLAIAEAAAERVFYDGAYFHSDGITRVRSAEPVGRGWIRSPISRASDQYVPTVQTIVPLPPADLRPAGGLGGLHVLFEVESWTIAARARVPYDPALLKWIGGDLWAVLAVWDLTPLERAILAGRAR